MGVDAIPRPDAVGNDELGFAVQRKPEHSAAPFRRVPLVKVRVARVDVRPHLVSLHVPGADSEYPRIEHMASFPRCRFHQFQNRIAVNAGQPFDRPNAHAFQHQVEDLSHLVQRSVMAVQRLCVGFNEGGFAGQAAVTLDSLFADVAKPLGSAVLTFDAGHDVFPLCLGGESATISLRSESWLTPRFGLAPQPVSAGSGALSVSGLWWLDAQIEREPAASELESNAPHCLLSFLKRSAIGTRGVSYFTPKSFLLLVVFQQIYLFARKAALKATLEALSPYPSRSYPMKAANPVNHLGLNFVGLKSLCDGVNRDERVGCVLTEIESRLNEPLSQCRAANPSVSWCSLQSAFNSVRQSFGTNIQLAQVLLKLVLLFFGKHPKSGAYKLMELCDFKVECISGLDLFAEFQELLFQQLFVVYFHSQTGV